jgi:hypothetical protein
LEKIDLLECSNKNLDFLEHNFQSIKKKFDKQWVVIQDSKIIANGSTYDEIMKKQIPRKETAIIQFIDSEQIAMFF